VNISNKDYMSTLCCHHGRSGILRLVVNSVDIGTFLLELIPTAHLHVFTGVTYGLFA
jgi:hypothetical protein